MSWQDVRHHYEERGDDPEATDVVTEDCPVCGSPYTHPADEAEPCCSMRCANVMHADRQAAVNVALAAWWAREQEQLKSFECVMCGHVYTDYPTTDGTCSRRCGWAHAAKLYDDVPF